MWYGMVGFSWSEGEASTHVPRLHRSIPTNIHRMGLLCVAVQRALRSAPTCIGVSPMYPFHTSIKNIVFGKENSTNYLCDDNTITLNSTKSS